MSLPRDLYKEGVVLAISIVATLLLILILSAPIMGMFALGPIVSPGGIFGASEGSNYVSETIGAEGVDNPVTIIRDQWGIPHIYAKTQKDAVFALGYCHAYDRMFQMEMTVRTGMGLMSEVMGNDSLEDDIWYETIGIEKAAQEMLDAFEKERESDSELNTMLILLDTYCEGVNYEIDRRIRSKTLPIEFQLLNFEPTPWTPLKTFVYNRLMSLMLTYSTYDLHSTIIRDELFNGDPIAMQELFPLNQTYYQIPIVPDYGNYSLPSPITNIITTSTHGTTRTSSATIEKILDKTPESVKYFQQSWIGSNNWVANGTKTKSGFPILCNDMHLSIDLPHIWYEAHLVASDDDWNIFGYTLTGTPIVVVGYNTHVAWGFTNVGPDGMDWYEYVWNNDGEYWNGTMWLTPQTREVTIPVKGLGNHTETIQYTQEGVIVAEEMGKSLIAMRWTATEEPTYEIKALYGANKAKNWDEFNKSMQWFHDPPQNVVFADADGTIALRPTGRFVKRNFTEGLLSRFIQNASDPEVNKHWEYIPFHELPYSVNPLQCYLASANQKSTGPDYQYYISSTQAAGYRGRSINRWLSEASDGTIDVDFMKNAQCGDMGIFDTCAEAFTPFFISAIENSGEDLSSIATAALAKLKSWSEGDDKYLMNSQLIGPTVFHETFSRFKDLVWNDEYNELKISPEIIRQLTRPQDNTLEYLVREHPNSKWFDNVTTTAVEDRDDIIVDAFIEAIAYLERTFGSNLEYNWEWGEYHRMYFNHLGGIPSLGKGSFAHDGSGYTLLAAGGRQVGGGPSERMVVDFGNITDSWSVIPGGTSGNPANPHYADQALELWMKKGYHLMLIEYDSPDEFPIADREAKIIIKPR
ncbi:MAG: penicillin acylase family protein [Candidatus Hodarchaeota archaeon]